MKMLINPSLDKLFLVQVKPGGFDIADFVTVSRQILVFELLYALVEFIFVGGFHNRMPECVELVPVS